MAPRDRGAGLTQLKYGVWSAFVGICRPVPRFRGGVVARSGHDLVGALACQHRECIVRRFWPEFQQDGSPRGGGSCPRMGLLFSVGLIPIGMPMWLRWWMALVARWGRSRSQRREPGISVWSARRSRVQRARNRSSSNVGGRRWGSRRCISRRTRVSPWVNHQAT